jgi:hypothetical protein
LSEFNGKISPISTGFNQTWGERSLVLIIAELTNNQFTTCIQPATLWILASNV